MFVCDADLAQWENTLPELTGKARLPALTALAWHLRQRDPVRARQLASEVLALLPAVAPQDVPVLRARLLLVAAEGAWVGGELDTAQYQADQALQLLAHGDGAPAGAPAPETASLQARADACWVQAWVANDRGNSMAASGWLAQAAAAAHAAPDPVRIDIIGAAAGICAAFTDSAGLQPPWRPAANAELDAMPAIAAGWISDFFGTRAFQRSEYGRAIGHLMRSFDTARSSGQVRRAIIIATNIGNAFTCLNAHEAALDWMQRGQDLARPTGWPLSVGMCLMQTAETLRQLGQREAAQTLLREALAVLAPLAGSRAYAVALEYEGDLALDLGNHAAALDSFTRLAARGDALGQGDFQSSARRGQAHALAHLGRPGEALFVAQGALVLARAKGDTLAQIAALQVLADIHALPARAGAPALAPPPEMEASCGTAPSVPLHYLLLALDIAATIDGYTVPGALLDATAREYAAVGDFERAYAIALRAGAARDLTQSRDATNRAIAMQVQYQTERAQTEAEHHRQLAAAEARRAEVLQRTSATLAHLGAVGQEITAQLESAAVFRALDRHVHGLLDATLFSVFLIEPGGEWLASAFSVEAGRPLAPLRVALDDPHADSARCVRERRELQVALQEGEVNVNLIPGTLPTLSMLFAPLAVGDRVLGVMTVQSMRANAYGERERLIFRSLCAYGAIALDNASAYRQVAATQQQLLDQNLELERAYQALEEVSLTDQLTGLRNRRFFLRHVDADVAMSLRGYDDLQHRPRPTGDGDRQAPNDLVFYMVDLDHFKHVNDRYGHAAGDSILVQMQARLREVFRESDYVIRWGGEEFLVLARATHRDDASALAERMRRAVGERDFVLPDGELLRKTCSIGFACFPFLPTQPRLLSWPQVVELADQGLYIAKRSGRDAWAALHATGAGNAVDLFPRLMHALPQALADGVVRVVSNLAGPLDLDGERRRTGLSIDLEL
ncbi:sensor domain-containing diguanylate cyclase [Duganella phyllosphaerae]|uniref:diguanylate cyclase n=1 Tax=Duganella phyllosphaerae TaxID=762836 RepID=A0A1E7WYI6_9BURK|nr:sensor domain-containing diguanylate cyclase [Duganella phyllosphaerae]OFA04721.1 response regulator PleD [Duganella phyllosphaerae]